MNTEYRNGFKGCLDYMEFWNALGLCGIYMHIWNDFKRVRNTHRILGCLVNLHGVLDCVKGCPESTWDAGIILVVVLLEVNECVKGVLNLYGMF